MDRGALPVIAYHVTTAKDGTVRLSKSGNWGNLPVADDAEGEALAEVDAKGSPFTIHRERAKH
jgi:hypothetical protein